MISEFASGNGSKRTVNRSVGALRRLRVSEGAVVAAPAITPLLKQASGRLKSSRSYYVIIPSLFLITLLGAPRDSLAQSAVQVASATPQSPTANVSVSYSSAQTAGDLNVVVVGWNDTTAKIQSVTDSAGNAPVPTVTTVSPNNRPTTGGTAVTISGTNFTPSATVTVGSVAATNLAIVNSTTITATMPSLIAGAATVTVTNSGGQNASLANGFTYVAGSAMPTPTFSPVAGTYTTAQSVTIRDITSGRATIHYTTNGTTPTTSSTIYTDPISVSATETVKAIAVRSGSTNSAVATAAYTIMRVLPTPTFSPVAGTYTTAQSVTISNATSGATIHYTTNGTTPTTSSTKYSEPISVRATETIEAIAVESGYTDSAVGKAAYTIAAAAPTFSPVAGTYKTAQSVMISDATSGATIYYTTNGTMPTTSSTRYTGPISVSSTETISAIAKAPGYVASPEVVANYTINSADTPIINCPSGFASAGPCGVSLIGGGGQPLAIVGSQNGSNPGLSGSKVLLVPEGAVHVGLALNYQTQVNVQAFTSTFTFVPNGWNIAFVLNNSNNNPYFNGEAFSAGAGCEAGFFQGFSQAAPPNNLFALELDSNSPLTVSGSFTYSSAQIYTAGRSPCLPNLGGTDFTYVPITKVSTSPVPLNSPASTQGTTTRDIYSATITYKGSSLTLNLYSVTAGGSCPGSTCFTYTWNNVNIPSAVGGNTAWVGFTAGTNAGSIAPLYVNSFVYTEN